MRRFAITWRYALQTIAIGTALAAVGGLVVRLTHASHAWSYAVIVGVTTLTMLKLTLFNGSAITITIRINHPPDTSR